MKRILKFTSIVLVSTGCLTMIQCGEDKLTVTAPVLTTTNVTDITSISAVTGGNISDDGGSEVTARGVCWCTTQNPTTGTSKTSEGNGTGSFTSNMTGLSPGTNYYVRAYATNSVGTSYGNEVTFKTSATIVPKLGKWSTGRISIGTNSTLEIDFPVSIENGKYSLYYGSYFYTIGSKIVGGSWGALTTTDTFSTSANIPGGTHLAIEGRFTSPTVAQGKISLTGLPTVDWTATWQSN